MLHASKLIKSLSRIKKTHGIALICTCCYVSLSQPTLVNNRLYQLMALVMSGFIFSPIVKQFILISVFYYQRKNACYTPTRYSSNAKCNSICPERCTFMRCWKDVVHTNYLCKKPSVPLMDFVFLLKAKAVPMGFKMISKNL